LKRKEIQLSRMWEYFVDATAQIIEEEGIKNVTIRKIADRAGFTSSTIYNYFTEVSHLIFFASMRFINEYIQELSSYMTKGRNSIEKYLLSWEGFCRHSFHHPDIFHAIFIADLGGQPDELLKHYFKVFHNDLTGISEETKDLVLETNLTKRNNYILVKAVEEGYLENKDIQEINDMTVLIWQGMLTNILNNRVDYTPDEAVEKTMKYIRKTLLSSLKKPADCLFIEN
jgi:AcrR family transcriptional regulator